MGDRKSEILEATCRVIGRSGAHDLRVEDVAKEAGVSPALVYYYFDTRGELLTRAFEFADARSTEHTLSRMGSFSGDGRAELAEILMHEYDEDPDVRTNWVIWSEMEAGANFDEELATSVDQSQAGWNEMIADLIRKGQEDRSISTSVKPDDAAERLTGVLDSLGTRWRLGSLTRDRAIELLEGSIELELGPRPA